MAKSRSRSSDRSGGRVARRNARRWRATAPPVDAFDEPWLRAFSERSRARYVDLTRYEDRRFWSPQSVNKLRLRTVTGRFGPRIVVVPEGHRLSRFQTYGGRLSLSQVLRGKGRLYSGRDWSKDAWRYGSADVWRDKTVSSHIGFSVPWKVIICVRRRRRREVIHAIGRAGKGKPAQRQSVRNEFSEVRC